MRVAALYDVHSNLPALEAVLAEVDADRILVGGDAVAGPWPGETLERLRGLGDRVLFIRGNADRKPLTRISPDERWADALSGVAERVVVCGHTHVQFDRRVGDVRIA